MRSDFEVYLKQSDVDRWLGTDLAGTAFKSARMAGAEAIRRARAESNRYIRSKKSVKVKDAGKGLVMIFPKSSKNMQTLVWKLQFSDRPIPVSRFGHPRQTRQGVTVQINKGKRVLIKSAFIATMRSGHEGVFKRKGKKRLPIRELMSSSVADVASDPGYMERVGDIAAVTFQTAFGRIFQMELNKRYA